MKFVHESVFAAPVERVFAFHEEPDAFERLLPPWETTQLVQPPTSLAVGTVVILRQKVGPWWVTIEAEHVAYEPGRCFVDRMHKGPFAHWEHRHVFLPHPDGCRLRDEIDYAPPLGWVGRLVEPIAIRPRLRKMFTYRHEVTRRAVER